MAITAQNIEMLRTAIARAASALTPREHAEVNRVVEKLERELETRRARKEARDDEREANEAYALDWNRNRAAERRRINSRLTPQQAACVFDEGSGA